MKLNLYKLMISLILTCFSAGLLAQNYPVKGRVSEADDGQLGIPGVSVIEKGTTNGTVTDVNGNYNFTVSNRMDTLVFSCIGYKTLEVPISGNIEVDVILVPSLTELDEVVVIGYGTQKKKVVTGSISTVDAEKIEKIPVLRIEQAMQGQAAGVQVTQMSGQPGEAPTVRIRGTGTTMDSNPLYVVDGMVVGGIDYLNPGDIQSIDVLKDAASAAIYGARAANGVVLITTKTGTAGKMSLNFSTYYGIQNVGKKLEMLDADEYRMIWNEAARNSNRAEPFDLAEVPEANTDWQEYLFTKNAPVSNYELSIAGGNDKTTYASSVSYFSQQGIIGGEKSQFDRITARLNGQVKATNWFTFGSDLAYSSLTRRGISSNGSFNTAYSSALNLDPLTPLYETNPDTLSLPPFSEQPVVRTPDGKVYGISDYLDAEVVNPIALLEIQTGETRVDKFVGNIFGEITFMEGLKFRSTLGTDLAYVHWDSYGPLYFLNGSQSNTDKTNVSKSMDRYFNWQWENTLTYTKKIKDHSFSLLAGTSAKEDNYENLSGFNADVPITDPDNVYLDMATDTSWRANGGARDYALFSMIGRVTYDFKSRYAFTGIIRRDGSSNFGPNNRYGWFPSVGVSWLLTEEKFIPELGPVDFLKLRASWGINGNDRIGYYQYVSTIDKSRGYIFGGATNTGASPGYIENADIKWEESEQIDIALDAGLFNNRLTATFDYYIKNTIDLLETIEIPGYVGNNPPVANVGSVRNEGVEMSINWRHYKEKIRYYAGVNAAFNKNTMTKIANEQGFLNGATWAVAGFVTRSEEGLPIAYFWGYKTDGIFQNENEIFQHYGTDGVPLQPNAKPGDVRFVDVNGDNKINEDDRTMIGNPTPDWTLGINGGIEYMNFDLSFLFTGAFGHQIFNGAQRQDLFYTNRTTAILDRWTGEGTSDDIPRMAWVDVNNNYRVSDLYIEDGDFLRLKNLQIGYTLPKKILDRIKSGAWRFYISAENLVTFTKYTGADPEIGAISSLDIGIDRGMYPSAVTFRFGTSISF
ncbi:MAG: TonB-dependent receptor [Bacteroidales bacterium]|jgi:TonB-linked SusC/RagA family outer membrane protein|nr:TonB-dependent receptor [Bacteroidales bacterium]